MLIPPVSGLVCLLTDFGLRDPYVGIMKGVIKQHHLAADLVDLCHEVPAQNLLLGGMFLRAAVGRFPRGSIHLAVVDPGVGTSRRILALCAHDCIWLAPDNGLLQPMFCPEMELRAVDLQALALKPESQTFHGRDLFAPLAGMLARGRYGFRALGPKVNDPVSLPATEHSGPRVIHVDHFGNLITNVTAQEIQEQQFGSVLIAGRKLPLSTLYQGTPVGEALALINSYGLLEIAVNCCSAQEVLGVGCNEPVQCNA